MISCIPKAFVQVAGRVYLGNNINGEVYRLIIPFNMTGQIIVLWQSRNNARLLCSFEYQTTKQANAARSYEFFKKSSTHRIKIKC